MIFKVSSNSKILYYPREHNFETLEKLHESEVKVP